MANKTADGRLLSFMIVSDNVPVLRWRAPCSKKAAVSRMRRTTQGCWLQMTGGLLASLGTRLPIGFLGWRYFTVVVVCWRICAFHIKHLTRCGVCLTCFTRTERRRPTAALFFRLMCPCLVNFPCVPLWLLSFIIPSCIPQPVPAPQPQQLCHNVHPIVYLPRCV